MATSVTTHVTFLENKTIVHVAVINTYF